jgi:formylglycine-generating enzyme required for sulfatase activity/uncharacterized caspase-like protein
MILRGMVLAIFLVLVVGLRTDGGAQSTAPYGASYAVVIGIGQYKDPSIRPLRYAGADARAVYDFLVDPKGGGYLKANVQLLLDGQATLTAVRSALGTTLARRAVQGDTVFIYYAGHGAPEADLANREPDGYAKFLVPYDADAKDLFATAINMAEVETFFSRIKADTVLLALDTCYSGAGGGRGFAHLPAGRDITLKGDFLARLAQGKGRAILTAADTNEVALELPDLGHGLFTYHLLDALRGKADPQGKGYVTLQDAYAYVYDRVARQSRRVSGNQNPKLIAQATGEIVLTGRPPSVASIPPPPRPIVKEEIRQEVGILALSAKVAGVEVWVGPDRIGETREGRTLVVENLPAGSHRVRASKSGFKPWERTVQVASNQRAEVVIDLDPLGPPPVIKGEDGAEMVLVPGGEFFMGSTREEVDRAIAECKGTGVPESNCKEWHERELPRHRLNLDAFHIDRHEVTNAQFARFIQAGNNAQGDWRQYASGKDQHPVVNVTWHDAVAYCKWAGKRLPTEAEWEKAARGTDGRRYPWGETWEPSRANGNMTVKTTTPVGSYPTGTSPYGIHDMAGNVWEWVSSLYRPYPYAATDGREDLTGSERRVGRGGSWDYYPWLLRSASRVRVVPAARSDSLGFRCAQGTNQ